jgi:hypothetical protein
MTQSHEAETVIFADRHGKPVDDPDKATTVEIHSQDGTTTILTKPDADGNPKPFIS